MKNIEVSLRFYEGLLHFSLIEKYPDEYARLKSPRGRTTIALHKFHRRGGTSKSNNKRDVVLYFETRNLDRVSENLAHKGVKFSQMPKLMPWGWKHAYLKDPDGHEISLYWAGRKRFEKTL